MEQQIRLTQYQMNRLADAVADRLMKRLDERSVIPSSDKMLTAQEAAEYLHISVDTLYNLGNKIPHVRVGRRSLYTERNLHKFIHK